MVRLGKPVAERPKRYSYSQLNLYWECPQKYYQQYVLKVPRVIDTPYMAWGTAVHNALEGLEQTEEPTIDVRPYVDSVNAFYESVDDEPMYNELALNFKLFGRNFIAKIDCLTANGYVVDYKVTSKPSSYKGVVGYQLPIYKMATQIVGLGDYTPQYILLKRDSEGTFVERSEYCPSLPKWKMDKIGGAVERILDEMDRSFETNVWPYRQGSCYFCPYKKRCAFYGY